MKKRSYKAKAMFWRKEKRKKQVSILELHGKTEWTEMRPAGARCLRRSSR
jgi:hypothetical protein